MSALQVELSATHEGLGEARRQLGASRAVVSEAEAQRDRAASDATRSEHLAASLQRQLEEAAAAAKRSRERADELETERDDAARRGAERALAATQAWARVQGV